MFLSYSCSDHPRRMARTYWLTHARSLAAFSLRRAVHSSLTMRGEWQCRSTSSMHACPDSAMMCTVMMTSRSMCGRNADAMLANLSPTAAASWETSAHASLTTVERRSVICTMSSSVIPRRRGRNSGSSSAEPSVTRAPSLCIATMRSSHSFLSSSADLSSANLSSRSRPEWIAPRAKPNPAAAAGPLSWGDGAPPLRGDAGEDALGCDGGLTAAGLPPPADRARAAASAGTCGASSSLWAAGETTPMASKRAVISFTWAGRMLCRARRSRSPSPLWRYISSRQPMAASLTALCESSRSFTTRGRVDLRGTRTRPSAATASPTASAISSRTLPLLWLQPPVTFSRTVSLASMAETRSSRATSRTGCRESPRRSRVGGRITFRWLRTLPSPNLTTRAVIAWIAAWVTLKLLSPTNMT
mmetsp:Transcript_44746/g.142502  ORF Transcript_44746/g.142502 Transcript_44746/m.142502 type:complete len:416 (+) Transcript_44746:173-1420(+)